MYYLRAAVHVLPIKTHRLLKQSAAWVCGSIDSSGFSSIPIGNIIGIQHLRILRNHSLVDGLTSLHSASIDCMHGFHELLQAVTALCPPGRPLGVPLRIAAHEV